MAVKHFSVGHVYVLVNGALEALVLWEVLPGKDLSTVSASDQEVGVAPIQEVVHRGRGDVGVLLAT